MRRCGAVRIVESLGRLDNPDFERQDAENQIMGWPDEGGVWILRLPPKRVYSMEEQFAIWARGEEEDEGAKPRRLRARLRKETEWMDSVMC
jgi:hypothetical protein